MVFFWRCFLLPFLKWLQTMLSSVGHSAVVICCWRSSCISLSPTAAGLMEVPKALCQ